MPRVELDKVSPASAAALQIGDSGDTITVPSGVTLTAADDTLSLPATITVSTEIKTNKISPATGTAFTFGDSGDTFNIPSGATITNSGTATGFGDCVLLSTQTASNSATVEFTSGIDSTYNEYVFKFINIDPVTDGGGGFAFQTSTDGGTSYTVTTTSTFFRAYHAENNSEAILEYDGSYDQAQGTGYQNTITNIGNASDENGCGELHLFNPASTTYVKNYYSTCQTIQSNEYQSNGFAGGYFNTTSAINAISFKMISGNINAGTIKMYGYT